MLPRLLMTPAMMRTGIFRSAIWRRSVIPDERVAAIIR